MSLCSRILVLAEGAHHRRGAARRRAPRPQGDRGLSRTLRAAPMPADDPILMLDERRLRLRQDDDPQWHHRQHPARRHHDRHRPQRRRQVDHVQDRIRAAAGAHRARSTSTDATSPTSRRARCSMPACATCRRAATSSPSCPCGTIWSSAASRSREQSRAARTRRRHDAAFSGAARRRRTHQASTLSGGQQKLLEVARGLLLDPKLMLIDEPSIGLSPMMVQEVFAILKDLRDKGVTILLIEQNAKQALQMSDYGLVLEQGQTRIEDTAQSILADPRIAQLFLGGGLQQERRQRHERAQKPRRADRREHHELAVAGAARGCLRRRRHPRPLPPDGPRPPAGAPARAAVRRRQDGRLRRHQRHLSVQAGGHAAARRDIRRGPRRSAPSTW